MRLLYFGAVVFTAAWLVVLLWRKVVAMRQVNVIVETPERAQQVGALERAFEPRAIAMIPRPSMRAVPLIDFKWVGTGQVFRRMLFVSLRYTMRA